MRGFLSPLELLPDGSIICVFPSVFTAPALPYPHLSMIRVGFKATSLSLALTANLAEDAGFPISFGG